MANDFHESGACREHKQAGELPELG
jgi:hypothetical protein